MQAKLYKIDTFDRQAQVVELKNVRLIDNSPK